MDCAALFVTVTAVLRTGALLVFAKLAPYSLPSPSIRQPSRCYNRQGFSMTSKTSFIIAATLDLGNEIAASFSGWRRPLMPGSWALFASSRATLRWSGVS